MSIEIRRYESTADRNVAFQLWNAAFGETWPLYSEGFYAQIDSQAGHHVVAVSDGTVCGFIAVSRDGQERGSIFAILVHPDHQGTGIEGKLLAAATEHLQHLGATKLRFGGGQSYFWPGVPTDQPQVLQLLQQHGWQPGGQIADMVGDVDSSTVPTEIADRIAGSGAQLRLASAGDSPAILAFEEQHFPQWLATASTYVTQSDFADILLAKLDGEIVGTTFLTPPGDSAILWRRMLGDDCAAYGAVGVGEAVRGRYIGYALAVRAAEILQERGAKRFFLGWVFSTDWYARLGYQVWKTYHQVSTELTTGRDSSRP
jgi:N-acetylglutamate synthase-like GNAT family acetyltransferase